MNRKTLYRACWLASVTVAQALVSEFPASLEVARR